MRPDALYSVEDVTLWLYEWIIGFYTPYILIRSAKFTNSKTQAERIAVYGLVTTCLLAVELKRLGQVGLLVDVMVDVVGEDLARRDTDKSVRLAGGTGDLLLPDGRIQDVAAALNLLDGLPRELLVFGHCGAMDAKALACLFHTSPQKIATEMARSERQLAQHLRHAPGQNQAVSGPDVVLLLAELAAALDVTLAERAGGRALAYLTQCGREDATVLAYWNLN